MQDTVQQPSTTLVADTADPSPEPSSNWKSSLVVAAFAILAFGVAMLWVVEYTHLRTENGALKQALAIRIRELQITEKALDDFRDHYTGVVNSMIENHNAERPLLYNLTTEFSFDRYNEELKSMETTAPYTNSLTYWQKLKIVGIVEVDGVRTFDPSPKE